jgi:hypothetical protein
MNVKIYVSETLKHLEMFKPLGNIKNFVMLGEFKDLKELPKNSRVSENFKTVNIFTS